MGKLIFLPCAALLAAAVAAQATPRPAPLVSNIAPSEAQKSATAPGGGKLVSAPDEKKICKQLPSTGSRLPSRACLTEREWRQLEAQLEQ